MKRPAGDGWPNRPGGTAKVRQRCGGTIATRRAGSTRVGARRARSATGDECTPGKDRIGVELEAELTVAPVERPDDGRHSGPGSGDDVRNAVAGHVATGDADAASKAEVVGEKLAEQIAANATE